MDETIIEESSGKGVGGGKKDLVKMTDFGDILN